MMVVEPDFAPFAEKMKVEGLPTIVIETFKHYYNQLITGHTGLIPENEIRPLETLPDLEQIPDHLHAVGESALGKTVILKLNGGLGTSMGLKNAKSLLPVKNDLTFLDIIARQALRHQIPLVLMNSYATDEDSLTFLQKYPHLLQHSIPISFLQHKVPKINQADLTPATYPADREHEWTPPGHGDIYPALVTSGILAKLLAEGFEYAFVSNADNLGAVLDFQILGYFVQNQFPFMMEVADRTEADKKGGHLAVRPGGKLVLRESAQVSEADFLTFQDISYHRYFNTNNIWIHLPALQAILKERNGIMGLPMICNRKPVNPVNQQSTPIYQLETAMGTAIEVFDHAAALRVPRTRFVPVKATSDLLALRSDAYIFTDDDRIIPNPLRSSGQIALNLDAKHYAQLDQLNHHFPYGPPSLVDCDQLDIRGEFIFGRDLHLLGNVRLINEQSEPVNLPDFLTIEGDGTPLNVTALLRQSG